MASSSLVPGTLLGQRYVIVREVAHGGMGAVYEAQDARLGHRRCALKVLRTGSMTAQEQAEAAGWFAREAELLSGLRHPLIPTISDFFSDQGQHYLVMDFVEGETLEDRLAERGAPGLPSADVVDWGQQVCGVLQYLHTRPSPVIFRDLKPANIMCEPAGTLKLIDFGIARRLDSTRTGQTIYTTIGTPGYSPPEQYQGLADPRSDIYALGATLHHLISGRDPRQHQPFTFLPLRSLAPNVTAAVEAAITRAVSLHPDTRFATAEEFAQALTGDMALSGQAPAARLPGPAQVAAQQPILRVAAQQSGYYASIQAALRDAPPGARVEVYPGHYAESLIVDKPVELVAVGPVEHVVVETINAPCLIMRADAALVRGFTLHGRRRTVSSMAPLTSPDTAGSQTGIAGTVAAILTSIGAFPRSILATCKDFMDRQPCHAVDIGRGQPVLQDCQITSESPWCVVAIHGATASPLLHRCTIHGGRDIGVLLYGYSRATLEECSILENGSAGVAITEGSEATMRGCTIRRGRGAGIEFAEQGRGLVEHCTICNHTKSGITVAKTARPIVRHCRIADNRGGAIRVRGQRGDVLSIGD